MGSCFHDVESEGSPCNFAKHIFPEL